MSSPLYPATIISPSEWVRDSGVQVKSHLWFDEWVVVENRLFLGFTCFNKQGYNAPMKFQSTDHFKLSDEVLSQEVNGETV